MDAGKLILLNGASSSGKTSVARALQQVLPEPFLHIGIDTFVFALPKRYLDVPLWHEVFEYVYSEDGKTIEAIRGGPLGFKLMLGMHRTLAALVNAGNNVIADHVLLEPEWVKECAALFK